MLELTQNLLSILLSFSFGTAMFCCRDRPARVIIIFVIYCSLYYLYTAPTIVFGDGFSQAEWMTTQSRNNVAMTGAFLVLLLTIYISLSYWQAWPIRFKFKYGLVILVTTILMCLGYLLNINYKYVHILENVSSIAGVVFILILLPIIGKITIEDFNRSLRGILPFLLWLLFLVVAFGFYEVMSQKAWATYHATNGSWILRASSIFFSPGWFGPWLALMWIIQMYTSQARLVSLNISLFGTAICGAGVFISGSRITLMTIMILLTILYLMNGKSERRYITVEALTFVSMFCITVFFFYMMFDQVAVNSSFYSLSALAKRWAELPINLSSYVFSKFDLYFSSHSIPPEFVSVIEDRVSGSNRDSAFLTVFDRGGVISFSGLFVLLFFWGYGILIHLKSKATSISKSYAVLLFVYFIGAGIHSRVLQAFPPWILAGSLVIATSLWLTRSEKV
jgi:hypothetical protein